MTAETSSDVPLLEARDITKRFPGVLALDRVSLSVARGEVLGVVGENGAGKSTLMNIIGGVLPQDEGLLLIDGVPAAYGSVHEAQQQGVVLIHQELNLAENLDVAGNVFLGREPRRGGPLGLISGSIYAEADQITGRLGLDCPPREIVGDLSVGQQQLVEIARALSLDSRLLIMDEPTSSLTDRETERLFEVIRDLKRSGVSVLYISHRLAEIGQICDRVSVLRDGRNAGLLQGEEITHDSMVRLMVGRELKQFFRHESAARRGGETVPRLKVDALRVTAQQRRPIAFEVLPGEIVGIAGLMGAGRTELAEAIAGMRPYHQGRILLDGEPQRIRSPEAAIAAGIFLVPEDRRLQGLVLAASVKHNISLPSLDRLSWLRLVARRREHELALRMCEQLNVRTPSVTQTTGLLSGGNQQKVVLAKWLSREPRVLILDEPTRGIDVGAKSEIYGIMNDLAADGVAILMVSSDLEEVLGMSDRVLVMHEGELAGELGRDRMSEEAIMHLATGGGEA